MGLKNDIREYLKKKHDKKRYRHILGVRITSLELGEIYCPYKDKEKRKVFLDSLALSSLLHDVDKGEDPDILWKRIEDSSVVTKSEKKMIHKFHAIYHAFSGAVTVKEYFKIKNLDIINSVKYHTTGRKGMSLMEKIIFLADYIEPSRTQENVDKIRKIAVKDIDRACYLTVIDTIKYLKSKGSKVNPLTLTFLNEMKKQGIKV